MKVYSLAYTGRGVEDVPLGEGRAVAVAGQRLAIFRTRAGWYALDGACPHLGGPLADGILADRSVICPLHERRFDLQSGADLAGGCPARTHPVAVVGEEVFVPQRDADSPAPAPAA